MIRLLEHPDGVCPGCRLLITQESVTVETTVATTVDRSTPLEWVRADSSLARHGCGTDLGYFTIEP